MFKSFIVNTHGPDPEGIRIALKAAALLCEQEKCSALLCVPLKKTAEDGVLNQVIPASEIKTLLNGGTLLLNGTCALRMESQKTLNHGHQGVVIALHVPLGMMDQIEKIAGLKAIIMVPWTEDEAATWKAKRHPAVLPNSVAGPKARA